MSLIVVVTNKVERGQRLALYAQAQRSGMVDYTRGQFSTLESMWAYLSGTPVESTLILSAGPTTPVEVAAALGAGPQWRWGQDARSGWVTASTGGRPPIHIGIREHAPLDPMIGAEVPTHFAALVNLMQWFSTTGHHYRQTPGVATLTTMGPMWRHKATVKRLYDADKANWWDPPAQLVDLAYGPSPDKLPSGLHRFDMRAAYLAAAAAAYLPRGWLEHTGSDGDPDAIGYFRIDGSAQVAGPYLASRRDRVGTVWVGSATLRELRRRAVVMIHDSWTADQGRSARIMRTWAEWYRDRVYSAEQAENTHLRQVLKRGYAEAFGVLSTKRGSLYRPDWRHLIIDQAQASLLRRIHSVYEQLQLVPVAIDHDSVWYRLPDPPGQALPELGRVLGAGTRVGNMRYEGMSP